MSIALLLPSLVGLIDKIIPDPNQAAEFKLRTLDMAQKGELAQLDAQVQLSLGQMEINKVEAQTDLFRGGWRPATGWVCVMGLFYQFLLQPILPWVMSLLLVSVPAMPPIDTLDLIFLLGGLLGLGGMRSLERVKNKI